MSAPSTVPVSVTEEAAARVAELGMQAELEQMIEYTRQAVPDLKRIEVVLEPPYDTWDQPYITIFATRGVPLRVGDTTEDQWGDWEIRTFPPQVCAHIAMRTVHETNHAG